MMMKQATNQRINLSCQGLGNGSSAGLTTSQSPADCCTATLNSPVNGGSLSISGGAGAAACIPGGDAVGDGDVRDSPAPSDGRADGG